MLLSSVILVLREVLEAALLLSLLMALSKQLGVSLRWVLIAAIVGVLGAAICGFNTDRISEFFDGVGQEVFNAGMQYGIFVLLCGFGAAAVLHVRGLPMPTWLLPVLMAGSVALALIREGSEIMIYISGFLIAGEQWTAVLAGGAIGAGIGVSVGAVFYFALLTLNANRVAFVGLGLLVLVAAGLVLQATVLLVQADWLPAAFPVWDSTAWLDEQSVAGQLLYALIGYEATPTALELGAYITAIVLITGTILFASRWPRAT